MMVSVVIPVFNTAPYLRECLDSVLSQTLTDFEVICVDDGSSDNSLAILREYEAKDSRIKVVAFPKNRGLCEARNMGIDTAAGDYVYILDSDDWIDKTYLEELYIHALSTGQDIVINRRSWYHGGGVACRILTPVEVLWDKIRVDFRFIWFRFKSIVANWDNNVWISFYNFINPFWKKA